MQFPLPKNLTPEQEDLLARTVYPKLSIAVYSLIDELLKNGEHLQYCKLKRQMQYEELLITEKLVHVKGYQDLGSDYDSGSDDECKKIKNCIVNYEKNNENFASDLEQVRNSEIVQGRLERLEKQKKNRASKQSFENAADEANSKTPKHGLGRSSYLFSSNVQADLGLNNHASEDDEDGEEEEEDDFDDGKPKKEKIIPFNPLKFLSERLRTPKQEA